jgi:hypothetical protein
LNQLFQNGSNQFIYLLFRRFKMSTFNFYADTNWNEVQESGEAKLQVPQGIVKVIIKDSEVKPGNGKSEDTHLVQHITLEVIEGEYKGAETKLYFSLRNPNEQAVAIAKSTMKSMFLAIGAYPKAGLNELHKKPFKVKVEHEIRNFTDNRTGEPRQAINANIKGYYAINTEVAGEDLPLVSAKESLTKLSSLAPAQSFATAAPQAARPPSAPPTAPSAPASAPKPAPIAPKAPSVAQVTTTEADISDGQPEWLS